MADRPPRTQRSDRAVILIVLIAATIGPAAVLISGAIPAVSSGSHSTTPLPASFLTIFAYVIVGLLLLGIAAHLIRRALHGTLSLARPVIAYGFAILFSGIVILLLIHFFAAGGASPATSPHSTGNRSGPPPPLPSNSTQLPLPTLGGGSVAVPIAYLLLPVILAIAVAVIFASARFGRPPRSTATVGSEPDRVRTLKEAIATLGAPERDARSRLIAVYARLLEGVSRRRGDLDPWSPGEVERECVEAFGIPTPDAKELRRLFEAARYSPHDVTDTEVGRARELLEDALARLAPRVAAPG